MAETFSRAAHWAAQQCGRAPVFMLAVAIIIVWAVTGPLFDYSDTWQLIINTGTTHHYVPDGLPNSKHPEP